MICVWHLPPNALLLAWVCSRASDKLALSTMHAISLLSPTTRAGVDYLGLSLSSAASPPEVPHAMLFGIGGSSLRAACCARMESLLHRYGHY